MESDFLRFLINPLNVFTTNLPYDKLIISENKGSDIAFPTTAFAIIGPKMKNSPMKEEDFSLSLSVEQECVYLNEQRIFNGTYTLKVGDRLIISGIAMEYRPAIEINRNLSTSDIESLEVIATIL